MRKLAAAALAACVVSLTAAAAPVAGLASRTAATTGGLPAALAADTDGNRVFDDLEARLAQLAPGERVGTIVLLDTPATSERIAALRGAAGGFAVGHRYATVPAFSAALTRTQVAALLRLPVVVHIEYDAPARTANDGARSSFGVAKAAADAPGLDGDADGNGGSYSPSDLVAGVVDTGIDGAHVDLDGGKVIGWKDFVNSRTTPYDDHGHGTHVASTIAGTGEGDARYAGVAPRAALVGVKVLNRSGSGELSTVAAGVDWLVQNRAQLGLEAINLSIQAESCSSGTDVMSLAVGRAVAAGLVVTAAAGNAGPGPCTITSPGAAPAAVTVGAMSDLSGQGFALASFSSRGPTADGRIKPDLVGPGVGIMSARANSTNRYRSLEGTSMAAPFVAGVALLMRDAAPGLSAEQVKSLLKSSAVDWGRGGTGTSSGSTGADTEYGAGRLDAYAALAAAGAALSAPPAMPGHLYADGYLSGPGSRSIVPVNVATKSFPIAATVIVPGFDEVNPTGTDLALYTPNGVLVASTSEMSRHLVLSHTPTGTGTYKLHVVSSSGGFPFYVDVSAGTGAAPPPPPSGDTTAPTVTGVSPPAGASSASPATNVVTTFSEAMNTSSAQSAFSLVRTFDSSPVTGSFSWSGNAMTFDPAADLQAGTQYTATVGTGARDLAGNSLAAPQTWSFTTASTPPPPGGGTFTVYPASTIIESGTYAGGTAESLAADDGASFQVASGGSWSRASAWYSGFFGVPNTATALRVTYSGLNSSSCSQIVAIYRWTDDRWVTLDSRTVGPTEIRLADLSPAGAPPDYVSGTTGTGEVRVRIRCTSWSSSWVASGDLLQLVYLS